MYDIEPQLKHILTNVPAVVKLVVMFLSNPWGFIHGNAVLCVCCSFGTAIFRIQEVHTTSKHSNNTIFHQH